ncbi:hypothetical protein HanHA300_Chr10g0367841 [Helianthus annuus]|nr:hypothetical protein HanHA300_Chr10g0367841 [Helianthus annuus]KAJ0522412.1 hypothetical protein HanIR_Chr10g0482361 [Helianthus annuus]KAJ0530422.1 hypothetical protein HanHA89_Chr10g0389701 [Helianthus annuus]KAJ0697272.1 hypothetical protein HanLR1_Chr10g0367141 [Helianthus annuus]
MLRDAGVHDKRRASVHDNYIKYKSDGTKLTSSEGSTKLASFSMCYSAQLYGLLCILRLFGAMLILLCLQIV